MARVYLVSESEMRALFARLSAADIASAEAAAWAREVGYAAPEDDDFNQGAPCDTQARAPHVASLQPEKG